MQFRFKNRSHCFDMVREQLLLVTLRWYFKQQHQVETNQNAPLQPVIFVPRGSVEN